MEQKRLKKYRYFADFSKEEAWLRSMAEQGLFLVHRAGTFGYYFEKGQPRAVSYRIDFRQFTSRGDFEEYLQLFSDSGWRHVAGTRHSGTQYFAPARPDVADDIFSDGASRAGRYRRLAHMWLSMVVLFTALLVCMVLAGTIDLTAMLNPKALYYTPGLWDATGAEFWGKFLFETPFALSRGFLWLLYPGGVLVSLYFMIRAILAGKKLQY